MAVKGKRFKRYGAIWSASTQKVGGRCAWKRRVRMMLLMVRIMPVMEVVREYPADERTATARTGLVGPAGVPGGVAGMRSRSPVLNPSHVPYTGMARSSVATLVAEDVDVTRAVGEEELPSNVLEVMVSSLKDDSLSRSMVRVVSNERRVSQCRIMSTRVAKRESSPLTVYMTRFLSLTSQPRWWLGWSITSSHGNQLGGDEELAERRRSSGGTEFNTNNMRSNLFSTTPFGPATNPFSSTRSANPFVQTTFSTPGFVSSSHTHNSSPFWPSPAPSQTPSPSSYPFGTSTSLSPFGTPDTSNPFGPAQAETPSVFYTTPSNPFGPPSSHSLFGTLNTSGFGTPSSIPTFGVLVTVAFGAPTTPVFGAPAFTASSTPAFGSLPTPAYGATSFSFSFSFPVFGQSASALGSSPFGAQSSPFGAHATAPNFGSFSSGQPCQQHVGSVSPPYAQTTEIFSSNAEKLESISATRTYEEKSHEELRWKDYQSGDRGGQTSNLSGSEQSQKPSLFHATNIFGATTPSPFGTPNTSNSGTSTSIFGTTQARGTNSMFGNTQVSPLFQSNFGQSTSPWFGFSTPIGTKNTSSSGTSITGFGARTLPSPSDTPNTPTSVYGSTPGLGATMSPSPFGTPNTSSASGTSTTTPGFGARTSPSPFDTSNTSTSVSNELT
nr:hypothetical protein [Tanacetum cinerariifolium]